MSDELTTRETNALTFSPEEVETIKNTVAREATDTELKLFLYQCKRTGLDPFSRQIYFLKMGGKASIQSSIDGLRLIAERSKKYQGQTLPQYLDPEGEWHEVWTQQGYPIAAKVGVHRSDFKEPMYAIARWDAYAPVYNGRVGAMWAKMPDLMLSKVAEALALRKAFPNDLSGIYTGEEMQQAEEPKIAPYKVERIVPDEQDEQAGHVEHTIPADKPEDAAPTETKDARGIIKELLGKLGKRPETAGEARFDIKSATNIFWTPGKNDDEIIKRLSEAVERKKELDDFDQEETIAA